VSDRATPPTPVSRRLVTRTAAWATPVVLTAVTAPAYAAASTATCTDSGQDPLNQGYGYQVPWFYLGDDPYTVDVDVATSARNAAGAAITPGSGTGTLQKTSYRLSYIKLAMPTTAAQGDTVSITLTLTRAVRNLTFTLTNVDKTAGQWVDQVVASPAAFGVLSRGANVAGSGTTADPFTGKADKAVTSKDASGDVIVTWPGLVQQVTVSYTAGIAQTSKSTQYVGVGGFSYDNCS
jgi:hypothetical protein